MPKNTVLTPAQKAVVTRRANQEATRRSEIALRAAATRKLNQQQA